MNREPEFSNQTVILVKSLLEIQTEGRLSSSEAVPIFTNIFSRKLSRLIPVLRGYGVEVVMDVQDCLMKRGPGQTPSCSHMPTKITRDCSDIPKSKFPSTPASEQAK